MIFIDTSFFIALLCEQGTRHEIARRQLDEVAGQLVTTNLVRGETWTWLRCKRWHAKAVEFLDSIGGEGHRIGVDRVSESLENEALDWLRRHDERKYSFVDATSFAYMRSRRITDALAFDGDFAAAGFNELRP